jgi:hypothetical protein
MKQQFIEPLKLSALKVLKVLRVLRVSGIMVMILSPALAVAGLIWEQHLHYLNSLNSLESPSSSIWTAVHSISVQPLPSPEYSPESVLRILCCVLLLLPFSLSLGICLHSSYRNHRAAMLRHQVARLERIWQLNIPSRRVIR